MQSEFRSSKPKVNTEVLKVCLYNLVKCIKCDVPCSEGYGPSNLVTNNFIERSKGFLAERFIKPPVNLTLEFKSEIDIEYLAITCSVGAQKSKGLELFCQTVSKGRPGSSCFESVASGVLPDDKIGFVFHKFNVNVKDRFGENFCFRKFKSSLYLSSVINVRVKIFCTSGTSIPAVGKIEIWGKSLPPLKSLPLTHDGTQALTCEGSKELLTATTCKSPKPKVTNPLHLLSVRANLDQSFTIPDDFIDPITCEVMIQPIILPSGKVIDISTLKSHEKSELKWGRGPGDPFTGVPFSDSNRPIAASDLKSRIDKFLSDNCNVSELQNIPRTLGTKGFFHLPKKQSCEVVISKLVEKNSLKSQDRNLTTNFFSSDKLTGLDQCKPTTAFKRKHIENDSDRPTCSRSGISINSKNNRSTSIPFSTVNNTEIIISANSNCATDAQKTFQERMEQSLELALKSTLSKLPKFTCDKGESNEGDHSTALCYACKSIENLFSIPCNHFVCRFCLLQVKEGKISTVCLLCSSEYKTSDVQKVHTR